MVWTSMGGDLWDLLVPSPWSPELAALGLSFMLAFCMCSDFNYCWVFLWWVLPSRWFTECHSRHHILYSVVQVWTGCVEADSFVCPRFWGFSLILVQLLVVGNFSIIELYFQIYPGLKLVWLPLPLSPSSVVICCCFLYWWVLSSRRYTGVHSSHLLLVFPLAQSWKGKRSCSSPS